MQKSVAHPLRIGQSVCMNENKNINDASPATTGQFKPSSVIIFEESDGFHYMDRKEAQEIGYLDARGNGYKSRAAAMRAARYQHESI